MGVIFVFVDGVGVGAQDPQVNPLARGEFVLSHFSEGSGATLPRGGQTGFADATLGVAGRPQSATGQTTLLTGVNAPRELGRHLLGFPNAALRELLWARSVFRAVAAAGRSAVFANAYPRAYLEALELAPMRVGSSPTPKRLSVGRSSVGRRRARPAATTVAFAAAGGRFRTWEDAARGEALTHDLTGVRAARYGAELPPRTPEHAAEILLRLAAAHDLTLFEFFETDEAGHGRSMPEALAVLEVLDRFLRALVDGLPPGDSLLVTSDHGNLEDLGTRNHTLARVPVLGFGPVAMEVASVEDLTGIAPLLLAFAGVPPAAPG